MGIARARITAQVLRHGAEMASALARGVDTLYRMLDSGLPRPDAARVLPYLARAVEALRCGSDAMQERARDVLAAAEQAGEPSADRGAEQ